MTQKSKLKRAIIIVLFLQLLIVPCTATDKNTETLPATKSVLTNTSYINLVQFPALFNPAEMCCRDFDGDNTEDDVYGDILALNAGLGNDISVDLRASLSIGNLSPIIDWTTAPVTNTTSNVSMQVYLGNWTGNKNYIERSAGLGLFSIDESIPSINNSFNGNILSNGDISLTGNALTLPIILGPQGNVLATLSDVQIDGNLRFEQNDCLGICSTDNTGGTPLKQGGLAVSGLLTLNEYFGSLDMAYRQCSCAGIDANSAVISYGENISNGTYDASCTTNTGTPGLCNNGCEDLTSLCSTIGLISTFADYDNNNNTINDAFTVGMRLGVAGAKVDDCIGSECPEFVFVIFKDSFENSSSTGGGSSNQPPLVNNQLFNIDENSPNGTTVGTVIASDPNSTAPNNSISWAIIGGDGSEVFSINGLTGEIQVADVSLLDYEILPSATLTVMVADGGSPRLANTAEITINLNNIPEDPIAVDDDLFTDEDTVLMTNIFDDSGFGMDTDAGGGNAITVSAINGVNSVGMDVVNSDGSTINIDSNGNLIFTPANSYQSLADGDSAQTTFTYTITDSTATSFATATVTVSIDGVNDAPSVTSNCSAEVAITNSSLNWTISNGVFVDIDGDVLILSAQLLAGNPLPTWLSFDDNTTTFSGVPQSADRTLQFIEITATDPLGLSAAQICALAIVDEEITGTSGADLLQRTNNISQFPRGLGENDSISMGDGPDIYYYVAGEGLDVIEDNGFGDADWLLVEGHTLAETSFSRFMDNDDLFIEFSNGDELIVANVLEESSADGIEIYAFDNGETITLAEIRQLILSNKSTPNDDTVVAFKFSDTINTGTGRDSMIGKDGSDLYIYQAGDGTDYLIDSGFNDNDKLEIRGYLSAQANIRQITDTNNLLVRFSNTDQITVFDSLSESSTNEIEELFFFDESVTLNMADIRNNLIAQQQTVNNDTVTGFIFSESINAGLGDDTLMGLDGSDEYIYNNGDGSDRIHDKGFNDSDKLTVNGYNSTDANIKQIFNGSDILIDFGSGDSIVLVDSLFDNSSNRIESIDFVDDNVQLSMVDLRSQFINSQQTVGDDYIIAFPQIDTIEAGLGNDYIDGGDNVDSYIFNVGDGHDTIKDSGFADIDVLTFSGYSSTDATLIINTANPNNVTFNFNSNDSVTSISALNGNSRLDSYVFDDTTWSKTDLETQITNNGANVLTLPSIVGTANPDTLIATASNEVINGLGGSDTYQFSIGFGQDIVVDNGAGNTDTIQFVGFNSTDVKFLARPAYETSDLLLKFNSGDSLVVKNFSTFTDGIEVYEFTGDAVSLNLLEVQNRIIAGQQTMGDDIVQGLAGNNFIDAGIGNDLLIGASGSDTYDYNIGDGHDTIEDNGNGGSDVLQISGYLSTDASYYLYPDNNNIFKIIFSSTDSIILINSLSNSFTDQIETIAFLDDGVSISIADLQTLFVNNQITNGDDTTKGFSSYNDIISGSAGDDFLYGLGGSDTYQYDMGNGHDRIEDNGNGGTDILEISTYLPSDVSLVRYMAEPNSIVLHFSDSDSITIVNNLDNSFSDSIEEIHFLDDVNNTIWTPNDIKQMILSQSQTTGDNDITAFNASDVIPSNTGFDRHIGKGGADTYHFNAGDGTLIIQDLGSLNDDTIAISGYASTDAQYRRLVPGSNDLLIEFNGSLDRIFVIDSLSGAGQSIAIEIITYSDDAATINITNDIEPGLNP